MNVYPVCIFPVAKVIDRADNRARVHVRSRVHACLRVYAWRVPVCGMRVSQARMGEISRAPLY